MINFKRTDHIHICVPPERLEEAKLFYTGVIGLKLTDRPAVFKHPGYWFEIGDIGLHIGIEAPLPATSRHSAFEIEDIREARKHLQEHGVMVHEEEVLPDRDRFFFIDPFGNRMELLQFVDRK